MPCSIELKNVSQSFGNISSKCLTNKKSSSEIMTNENKSATITLFKNLDLTINQGQSYAITGPSGAGKSSLLMLLSGLEKPTSGQGLFINDDQLFTLETVRSDIGFIFQQFHLLPELTALHNVALPLKLRGDKHAISKATHWLKKVGLSDRAGHKPSQLSGGEQQRVAIARALVFSPKFIFADEPTGNLDQHNAKEISDILFACCQENNAGLIIVTHSNAMASKAQHIYSLAGGKLTKTSSIFVTEKQEVTKFLSVEEQQVTSC